MVLKSRPNLIKDQSYCNYNLNHILLGLITIKLIIHFQDLNILASTLEIFT